MDVKDKFVIVGVTANGVMPQLSTPVGLLEPHKIQAALAESILIQNSPYIPDYSLAVEMLIFALSVACIWLVLNVFGITLGTGISRNYRSSNSVFWILLNSTWNLNRCVVVFDVSVCNCKCSFLSKL